MIYLTGNTHGRFERIGSFCEKMQNSQDDILIILGDAGINFHAGALDTLRKEYLSKLPITLLCIHGNHERRPESLPHYGERKWHGGKVYAEGRYPNILFAKDGEVYGMAKKQLQLAAPTVSIKLGALQIKAGGQMNSRLRRLRHGWKTL